jgi:hypothetical protein
MWTSAGPIPASSVFRPNGSKKAEMCSAFFIVTVDPLDAIDTNNAAVTTMVRALRTRNTGADFFRLRGEGGGWPHALVIPSGGAHLS